MRPAIGLRIGLPLLAITSAFGPCVLSGAASAQKAGDVAVFGATIGPVQGSGAVYDRMARFVVGIPVRSPFGALGAGTAAPDNDGVIFAAPRAGLPVSFDLLKFNGAVTSLAPMPTGFFPRQTRVDQNGDPLVLIQGPTAGASGIYRVVSGALATVALGFTNPGGFGEDVDTGHFVVVDSAGTVFVVSKAGAVLATRPNVFPANTGAMHEEYSTGALLAAAGAILRYDVKNSTVSTALAPATVRYGTLDYDPAFDGYWAAGGQYLDWLDRNLNRTSIARAGLFSHSSVVSWGSRILTGRARPMPGGAYPVVLAMPGESLKSFQAAASFGTRPGIRTAAGTVHLNPDGLFSLSVSAPAIFAGFSGTLSANGTARLTVQIPSAGALRGLRFFVAAVSYDAGGIRRVSEPLGVTVQ